MANAKHQHVNAGQETYPLHERQQPQKGSETRMEGTQPQRWKIQRSSMQGYEQRKKKKQNTALSHLCRLKGVGKGVLIGIPPLVPPPGSPSPSDRSPQPKRHKSRGSGHFCITIASFYFVAELEDAVVTGSRSFSRNTVLHSILDLQTHMFFC